MYGVVLATMLTAGTATPDWGFRGGCHGCYGCYGCYGCAGCYGCYGCSGCYGGCYGCYGCSGCYGCWGCSGCYGCYGCFGGCCGYSYYAPVKSYYPAAYYSSCYGCYGCCGGYGGPVYYSASSLVGKPVVAPASVLPAPSPASVDAPATVTVKAPADVVVTVNGQATTRRTEAEEFATPSLKAGQTYAYQFRAEATRAGKKVVLEKRVTVQAGQKTEVDFTALASAAGRDVAKLTVVGPATARVIVNGVEVGTVASRPIFETPKLEAGRKYFYTVRAIVSEGRSATKRVNVEAGKDVTVDFSELSATATAAR